MNAKQKERVKQIIQEDCKIAHYYINPDGETCALGALALAAGVPKDVLLKAADCGIGRISGATDVISQAIEATFGIDLFHQMGIQRRNDSLWSPESRRLAILKLLEDMPLTEDPQP